jgi:biopolymer transport protein ExbD
VHRQGTGTVRWQIMGRLGGSIAMSNRKTPAEVELNLAAMLDMAFQILTFFILTFRPSPIEGQVELRMPPPKPLVVKSDEAAPHGEAVDPLANLRTLPIVLTAANNGSLAQVVVAGQVIVIDPRLALLNGALSRLLGNPVSPFDQVLIEADPKIRYDEVMRVLDICSRQRVAGRRPALQIESR